MTETSPHGTPRPERIYLDQGKAPGLKPETFSAIFDHVQKLTEGERSENLIFDDAFPFFHTVLQEELEGGEVGNRVESNEEVGRRRLINKSDGLWVPATVDVASLNTYGVGYATAESHDPTPVSRLGYIRFKKQAQDLSTSLVGIMWLKADHTISCTAEVLFTHNIDIGFEMQYFAGKLGVGLLWATAMTRSDTEESPAQLVSDFNMSERMGQQLLNGLQEVDQSVPKE